MANTFNLGNKKWAVKEDQVLAYNSENNNFKPLPFDFTRASNATVVNKAGLIEEVGSGEPRIDFQGNTDGHLLLEPSRTNAITYSEDFTLGGWTSANVTVTSNYGTSPDGNLNSTKLVFGSGAAYINRGSGTGVGDQASSIYVKGISGQILKFGKGGNVASGSNFTLNGEWQRLVHISTNSGTAFHITSNLGGANATEIEVYGAQLEDGSYATSYIPTSGSSVTRVAEICTGAGNDQVFNGSEGAIFLNFASYGEYVISLDNGTATNRIQFFRTLTNDRIYIMIGGTFIINEIYRVTSNGVYNKYGLSYESGNILLYVNGSLSRTYTTPFTSTPFTKFRLNQYDNNTSVSLSLIESKIYNTALTDAELIALTTL